MFTLFVFPKTLSMFFLLTRIDPDIIIIHYFESVLSQTLFSRSRNVEVVVPVVAAEVDVMILSHPETKVVEEAQVNRITMKVIVPKMETGLDTKSHLTNVEQLASLPLNPVRRRVISGLGRKVCLPSNG